MTGHGHIWSCWLFGVIEMFLRAGIRETAYSGRQFSCGARIKSAMAVWGLP
jgi:hypothetical protein